MMRGAVNLRALSATSHPEESVGSKLSYYKAGDEPAQTSLALSIVSQGRIFPGRCCSVWLRCKDQGRL